MEKRKLLIMLFLCVTTFFKIVNAHEYKTNIAKNYGDGTIVVLDDDLKVDHPTKEILTVMILDKYGNEVTSSEGNHETEYIQDVSEFESDIYIIVATTETEIFSKQVYIDN